MISDPLRVVDGFQSLGSGVNNGSAPVTLPRNQVSMAVNAIFRGEFIAQRPGWERVPLVFEDNGDDDRFQNHIFQRATFFHPPGAPKQVVASIRGRLFAFNLVDRRVFNATIPADPNIAGLPVWFCEAEQWLIVQDGRSKPLLYNGSSCRRLGVGELPVGTIMAYANGRVWVANIARNGFTAGDIVGGPSGTPAYNYRDAILRTSENAFLATNGNFSVPANMGLITAMVVPAAIDTSLGQGPLQVCTAQGIVSVNAPTDRSQWQTLTYPLQTISVLNNGMEAQTATVLVNGDVWYRSPDGIRSFQVTRRDTTQWTSTPLSREMRPVLDKDQPDSPPIPSANRLAYASAALFDNRLLVTTQCRWEADNQVTWRALVSLDFDPLNAVQNIATRNPPAYDGIWTGLRILQVLADGDDCIVFALNNDNQNEVWRITKDAPFDDGDQRVAWSYETPAFNFSDKGFERKSLDTGVVYYNDLQGTVSHALFYRPDQATAWQPWANWQDCATMSTCGLADCAPPTLQPQYRTYQRMPMPADDCNPQTGTPYRHGFEFQVRHELTGHCSVRKLALVAHQLQEDPQGACPPELPGCLATPACPADNLSYTIT